MSDEPIGYMRLEVGMSPTARLLLLGDAQGEVTLTLRGPLDAATAPALRKAIDDLPTLAGTVVLDLAEAGFIDSAGIGCLFRLQRRVADAGGMILARHAPAQLRRLLDITQLNRVIAVLD